MCTRLKELVIFFFFLGGGQPNSLPEMTKSLSVSEFKAPFHLQIGEKESEKDAKAGKWPLATIPHIECRRCQTDKQTISLSPSHTGTAEGVVTRGCIAQFPHGFSM